MIILATASQNIVDDQQNAGHGHLHVGRTGLLLEQKDSSLLPLNHLLKKSFVVTVTPVLGRQPVVLAVCG